ncbi:hypothetical protein HOLleu_25870 [Holothuria leucospilota]|uniref:Uncharacterized protein n=1 Tax=Holothuria leucospilota TaxID=206669 RepID=A0A9Q1BTM1_HOLLE|nr:hypothetical protein HOLleu_25870 [Holothuria leucospilota]
MDIGSCEIFQGSQPPPSLILFITSPHPPPPPSVATTGGIKKGKAIETIKQV